MSDWLSDHHNRLTLLRGLIVFTLLTTTIHFTHNFLEVEDYPNASWASGKAIQIAIALTWPVLTACGLYGYGLYKEGRYPTANLLIGLYSILGFATLGHFTAGNPDIPPFFYATIFTDGLAGVGLLAFALYSARAPLSEPVAAAA